MPAELDDIELRSVQLQQSHSRDSISNSCDIHSIPTDKGDLTVAVQGDLSKPAILTLHDLGLNCNILYLNIRVLNRKKSIISCIQFLILNFRCIDIYWLLQLSNYEGHVGKFLRFSCYISWSRG